MIYHLLILRLRLLLLLAVFCSLAGISQPGMLLNRVEYFIDTDPGFDKGISIPITSALTISNQQASISLSGVSDGFHQLFLRGRRANGTWSVTNRTSFYKVSLGSSNLPNLTKAEYFIDIDPGFGNATNIPVSAASNIANKSVVVPIGSVPDGFHNLYIRTQNANGIWSVSNRASFYKVNLSSNNLPNLTKAEYFIDTDPGFGKAINIPIAAGTNVSDKSVTVPISSVPDGFHNLYVRTQNANGAWSISNRSSFYKVNLSSSNLPNLTKAEYFIDTDPGFGNATNIPIAAGVNVTDKSVTVSIGSVPDGFHNIYVRTQNANGTWSVSNRSSFYKVSLTSSNLPNLVKAEYFIDTDPGFGKGTNIPISAGTTVSDLSVPVNLAALNVGDHKLFIRALDAKGSWSVTNVGSFNKPQPTDLILTVGTITPSSLCAGGTIQIPYTINAPYSAGNVFTAQLSNAVGNFTAPVVIGTLAAIADGTISGTIPANTPAGTNYRVRILSNNPADISDTSTAITVLVAPAANITINGGNAVCLGSATYSINNPVAGNIYSWSLPTGGSFTPATGNSTTVTWNAAGVHTLTATASNACGVGNSGSIAVTVSAGAPGIIPGVTVNNRILTASALTGNATAWQWYKDNAIIAGATNQNFTVPNADAGMYSVAYTNACGAGNASPAIAVAIAKTNQTLSFSAVPAKTFGDAPFSVTATASSGLAISGYSIVSGPGTISGNTITITGAGTIVVKATQDGNATFNAAENTLSIVVNKAVASIVLGNLAATYDGTAKMATATTTPLGLNALITYNGSSSLPINAASYAVVATITSANYQGSTNGTFVIEKASQSISITNPGNKRFSDAAFGVNAVASSGLPVALSITTLPATGVASIAGNVITLLGGGGTVTIMANQAGNTNYLAATTASISFTVSPPAANDLQLLSLLAPVDGCNTGVNAPVSISIRNAGTAAASNFTVGYKIGDAAVVTETFTGSIAAGANANFTFNTKGIFAQTGVAYPILLFTALAGDERLDNDTLQASIVRFATPSFSISKDTAICLGQSVTLKTTGASSSQWTGGPNNATFTVSPATTTTYEVQVKDINACSTKILSTTVTVNPLPTVSAGPDVAILKGSSTTLQASGAVTYKWSNGVETASNTVSPASTSIFTVTGTNGLGCKASDDVTVQVNFSALTVSPGIVQFGGVVQDSIKTNYITVTNTGTLVETVTAISAATTPFSIVASLPISLPAGTSAQIPVAFAPTATLVSQQKITISTSAGNFDITLRGTGVEAAPAWTVSPASFNFGKIEINTNNTQVLKIKNTGNIAIRISGISSSSPRFTATTNGMLDIPVGAAVDLAVRFSPNSVAAFSGGITVRTSTPGLSLLKAIVAGIGYIPGPPPVVSYLGRAPFDGIGGVTPKVGQPGVYTYSILYKNAGNIPPLADFPKVGIDKNNDGDFSDEGEGVFSLVKESSTSNWVAGEVYSYTTYLGASELYGYQFFATDANNNEAILQPFAKGPIVTREILDLHIFASDIVFSKTNPAVNESFTVTATIHNNSPYATSDVPIRMYYKDSLFLLNDTIPIIDGNSAVSITHTLSFSPDGFYPIKIWIDSSNTLGEGNLLNNYASRPIIIGHFTVPGTIDLVSNATPSGCNKGKVTYSGRANYRGLNLAGTPPVEGAEVTINIPGFGKQIKTTTDINGNWYYYHDPCAEDPGDADCQGYLCGVTYNYTVEVTDFTLTSPSFAGSSNRACVNCNPVARMQTGVAPSACILEHTAYTVSIGAANFEYDFSNRKICAPTAYLDTFTLYINGQEKAVYQVDSIISCGSASFAYPAAGLPVGKHELLLTHSFYLGNNERFEDTKFTNFEVLPALTDLTLAGITKTGHTSFSFVDVNIACGVPAGAHMIYLYDSLPGFTENILIDSFAVAGIAPNDKIYLTYSNPNWAIGYHYLTLITDVKQVIPELREDNNILKAIFYVLEPDIYVEQLRASSSTGIAGSLINFTANVINKGSAVNQPFAVQFRVNGSLLGSKINIPSLGINDTAVVVSTPFTVPVSLCPVEVTIFADSDQEIQEYEEKNNFDTLQYGINIKAGRSCSAEGEETTGAGFFNEDDVLNTSECFPYLAPKGILTYFATTVRNKGTRDARNIKVQFKLNGVQLGTDVIPLLKAGQKTESGFFYAFDTLGRFIVNAFADYTREICEIDETDNIGFIHIDVKRSAADLEVLSQYIAPSNLNPSPNQPITIVASVVNKGDAPSVPALVRFWVNDVPLGADIPIDSLYPGQDTTVQATVTYASGIVGPKIIKFTADITNLVAERRKGNNEATRAIIVGAAPDFAHSISEAITLSPATFNIGDTITIRNYLRNYGGDGGAAWLRFYYRNMDDEKILIDSVRFALESNDSGRIGLRWKVAAGTGQIITEIAGALPPEFNELNNIDSLHFDVALPLTLLAFEGHVVNSQALLQWKTTNEHNVQQFDLERSTNGNQFEKIVTTPAISTSDKHSYQYTDNDFNALLATKVYYRLKMIDKDGQFSYSQVVLLTKKPVAAYVRAYPNPVKNTLQIQIQSLQEGNYNLTVLDAQGRRCISREYNVVTGLQTLMLPVQLLAQGWYILQIWQPDGSSSELKFIKE